MARLEGTFRVMSWEEDRYDAAPGQPKFTHARAAHELLGDGAFRGIRGEGHFALMEGDGSYLLQLSS